MLAMRTKGHLDVSILLCTLLLKIIGLWTAKDVTEERRRNFMIGATLICTILAVIVEARDFYFTYIYKPDDIPYVFTNILTVSMALIKLYIILVNKLKFLNLLVYVKEKFWNAEYDSNEEEILSSCRTVCIFFISGVSLIASFVYMGYMATPYFKRSLCIHRYVTVNDNSTEGKLPFKWWIQLTPTKYYTIFFIEVVTLFLVGVCYFCFDNVLCVMAIHLSGQFRILQYRLEVLCDTERYANKTHSKAIWSSHIDNIYAKLKDCVRQHQALIIFCDRLEDVFTIIIFLQVLMFSLLICMFGYQIVLADIPFARRCIFIFLLIGSMFLLFMFTYSCDSVIQQSGDIAIGAYSAMWMNMPMNISGKMLRNDLIMIIRRSRRACCLTANGFFPVSLETYTSILSTAMSYFTLMKNNVENAN